MRCAACSRRSTAQVREHDVDVVIVAGDVFDSATPAAACYTLLTDTLRGAVATTGAQRRRDERQPRLRGPARLPVARCCATASTSSPTRSSVGTPITIDDEHGPVHFYGIPFLEPASCATCGPSVELRTQRADARRTRWGSSAPTSPSAAAARS